MAYEFSQGPRLHGVEIRDLGASRYRVRWTLRGKDGVVAAEREMEIEAREVGEASYSVLVGTTVVDARVERAGARRTVELLDGAVDLELLDPLRPRGGKGGVATGPVTVSSPIPGRVVRVPVSPGDEVAEGQAVIVVEAMKMANELRSPIPGRVAVVKVEAGSTVEAGAPLVVITPAG